MLHDGGQSNGKRRGQSRNRDRADAQPLDDRASGGIAKSMEDAVDAHSVWGPALTKHGCAFRDRLESSRQFACETFEQFGPAFLSHLWAVGAFEKRSLLGENEVRAFLCR